MKKKVVIVAACAVVLVVAFVFLSQFLISKPIETVMNIENNKTYLLIIGDGTSENSFIMENKKEIREVINSFKGTLLFRNFSHNYEKPSVISNGMYIADCAYSFEGKEITIHRGKKIERYISEKAVDKHLIDELKKRYEFK